MGSERLSPAARVAVLEYRGHHALLQVGVVDQEEGGLRISEVYGVDTTVGVILLGEEQQVAVLVLKQLVSCDDVTVCARENLCILHAARSHTVIVYHLVERTAA